MDSFKEALLMKIKELQDLLMLDKGDEDVLMEPEHDKPDMEAKEEEKERQEEDKAPLVKDKSLDKEDLVSNHPGRGPISFKEKAKAYKG